jgi:hypothetical protein
MKNASECLEIALRCEALAEHTRDASSTRLLQEVAGQWRKLARQTPRHERLTGMRDPQAGRSHPDTQ